MKPIQIVKVLWAIPLLVCLFDLPYGYFQFIRFGSTILFGWFAYEAYRKDSLPVCYVYAALALLFQPLFKVALGRPLWNIVDVVVAVWLVADVFVLGKRLRTGE